MTREEWIAENERIDGALAVATSEVVTFGARAKDKTSSPESRARWLQITNESKERIRMLQQLQRRHAKRVVK